jgi:glucokinase
MNRFSSSQRVSEVKEPFSIGRPAHLRHTNALTILRLLRESVSCSRADLVRASGLSAPTVTNVVSDLLQANLIKALGEGESSGGRPPDMISFNAARGCLLAVQITSQHLSFLLTDLSGMELETSKLSLEGRRTTREEICQSIGAETRRLLKKQKRAWEQLLVTVVAVPAITNVADGIVVSITTLEDWKNVPLRSLLNKVVPCLVIVENDTNLSAIGERFRGAARGEDTFVLISIGANVSAGIVLSGCIHRGAQWSAGEIAYLRLPQISRTVPALYQFGELENVLTSPAIVEAWLSSNDQQGSKAKQGLEKPDVSVILDLAQQGDLNARSAIDYRAAILSDIVTNLALILNPRLILLAGEVGSHPAMLLAVQQELDHSEFAVPKISAAKLQDSGTLWGAIATALEEITLVLLPQP